MIAAVAVFFWVLAGLKKIAAFLGSLVNAGNIYEAQWVLAMANTRRVLFSQQKDSMPGASQSATRGQYSKEQIRMNRQQYFGSLSAQFDVWLVPV